MFPSYVNPQLNSIGSTFSSLFPTTVSPNLKASVLAMNTSYSNALHLANSTTPFLYYSNLKDSFFSEFWH